MLKARRRTFAPPICQFPRRLPRSRPHLHYEWALWQLPHFLILYRIVTSTTTTTTGTTIVVEPASTSSTITTLTPTNTVTDVVTIYSTTGTSTSTSTITSTSVYYTLGYPTVCTATLTPAVQEREILVPRSSIAKPSCFSAYTSGVLLSSACSCLSIQAPTSTVTAQQTVTVTSMTTSVISVSS